MSAIVENVEELLLRDPDGLVGAVIADRYRLTGSVSEGSSIVLFEAIDTQTSRIVHVKLLRPELTASPAIRDPFDDQMRAAAGLSHPNIAAVYDWGIAPMGDASVAFIVVEHLTGGSLRDLFDRGRRLSPSQALAVGLDACKALDYAHRRGQIHTEINPSKLVFGGDRRLRIVDFGLARLLGEQMWRQPDLVPTHQAWYAAPEQGLDGELSDKVDVYALCLSLNEAVTGELPFKSDSTVNTLANRVGRLLPVSADLGPLASVFEHAGRPDAAERSSASEFGRELVRAASKLSRPEPLPLLSTGLFDVPAEQLRSPDDPTGGVRRPSEVADADPTEPIVIVEAAPDTEVPDVPAADDLVIRALDDEPEPEPEPEPADDLMIVPLDTDEVVVAEPAPPATTAVMPETPPEPQPEPAADMSDYSVPARRWVGPLLKTLLGLVVIAALVALGFAASQLFATTTHTVPDMEGLNEAEARNLVAANNWEVAVDRERSDVEPEVDMVVRTQPAAGAELAESEPFLIVVSDGPELRELPESTGLTLAEAQRSLIDLRLVVDAVDAYDEEVPDGSVISWAVPGEPSLTAGSMVEPETPVELTVSIGPEPRTVPDLLNLAIDQARQRVEDLQLTLSVSGEEFSDDVPEDAVITQVIAPGTEVERGADLAVVVSKGPDLVAFPDLSDATTFQQVQNQLGEAGFASRLSFGDDEGTEFSFRIDGEEPDVGEQFRRGTRVDITAL